MAAPHAHVDNTKGARNKFGQDRNHLKTYKISRKSIFNRPLINIDLELHKKPEIENVKELRRRLLDVRNRESLFEESQPKTFKMSKQLTENRRRNEHELQEHIMNLAALQRRIAG